MPKRRKSIHLSRELREQYAADFAELQRTMRQIPPEQRAVPPALYEDLDAYIRMREKLAPELERVMAPVLEAARRNPPMWWEGDSSPADNIIDRANGAPLAAARAAVAQVEATNAQTAATDAQTAVLRQVLEQMAAPRPSESSQLSQAPSPSESSTAPAQAEWRMPDRWRQWPQRALIILDLRQAFPEHFGQSPGAYPNLPTSLKQMKRAKVLEGLRVKGLPEPADSTLRKLRKVDVGDGTA